MTMSFSPIILVVSPRSKDDVLKVASAAARHRIPVMVRGSGTSNWGQGIPLAGGIVLDMKSLSNVVSIKDRLIRVEPGAIVEDVDRAAQQHGLELRMHPTTRRIATIGGYVAGGHVGVGFCTWGILRDRGSVVGIEVVSMEETPP